VPARLPHGPSAPSQLSVRRRVGDVKGAYGVANAMSLRSTLDIPHSTSRSAVCEGAGTCAPLRVVGVVPFGWRLLVLLVVLVPGRLVVVGLGSAASVCGVGSVLGSRVAWLVLAEFGLLPSCAA
jgi:hypothetical protein